MSSDTSIEIANRQYSRLAEMSPAQRGSLMSALCDDVTELALAGIGHQHPNATPLEVRYHLLVKRYGKHYADSIPTEYR